MDTNNFEPEPRFIEIEVPNDATIFFYKAGIKAGLESMEQCRKFFVMAGDDESASRMIVAIGALTAFLDTIREVETDIVIEFQGQQKQDQSASIDFAPRIEDETN